MRKISFALCLLFCMLLLSCNLSEKEYHKSTNELKQIVEENPDIKNYLEKSIALARQVNPDKETNPIGNLEEYYDFVEWSTTCMPWNVYDTKQPKLYDQIDQSLIYFYFIPDQPLDELRDKGYYYNSLQYMEPYRTWLKTYAKQWGDYLSTPDSWNDTYYNAVCEDERFGLAKGWYEDPSKWKSFNDFFARYLSSPNARPICERDNPYIVTSAADSKPQGVWQIDENSNLVQKEGVVIKSRQFNSISQLLGNDSPYGKSFAKGTLTHSFLDVNDYHRYHFPVSGTIKEIHLIEGDDAAGGITIWDPKSQRYILEYEIPGWQMIETRGLVVVESDELGLVAMLPIGMSQVSSVNFEKNLKVGDRVNKGDMLGYFLFGGSDFVILFQEGIEFTPAVTPNTHLLMGEKLGTIQKSLKK